MFSLKGGRVEIEPGGRNSSTQLRILLLDDIGAFLNDHVHDVLDATVRDDREETGVNDSELFGAVDAVIAVDHTLGDALTQVTRAVGVEARLRALEDHGVHGLVAGTRHGPGVAFTDDVPHPFPVHDDVVHETDRILHYH